MLNVCEASRNVYEIIRTDVLISTSSLRYTPLRMTLMPLHSTQHDAVRALILLIRALVLSTKGKISDCVVSIWQL